MIFFRILLIMLLFSSQTLGADSYLKAHELKIAAGNIVFTTASSQSASYGLLISGSDSHYLNSFPSLGGDAYNLITQSGDGGIFYSSGSINSTDSGLVIAPWSTSAVGIRMIASGNVGIGVTVPKTALSVNGTVLINQNLQVDGNLLVSGNIQFGGNINPVGSVIAYAGNSLPTGWLLCDGSAVSRSTYSSLYSLIGTTYGPGDGSSTFNLPYLTGRRPMGLDSSDSAMDDLGDRSGVETVSGTSLPSHYHSVPDHTHTYEDVYYSESSGADHIGLGTNHRGSGDSDSDNEDYEVSRTTASGGPGNTNSSTSGVTNSTMNIMNPYVTMKYIIKY